MNFYSAIFEWSSICREISLKVKGYKSKTGIKYVFSDISWFHQLFYTKTKWNIDVKAQYMCFFNFCMSWIIFPFFTNIFAIFSIRGERMNTKT